MEYIYIIKAVTRTNYGRIMFEKHFYYKTNQLAYKSKIQLEKKELERVSKSKLISKIAYVDRTGEQVTFESNNGFYKVEYSVLNAPIITEVIE